MHDRDPTDYHPSINWKFHSPHITFVKMRFSQAIVLSAFAQGALTQDCKPLQLVFGEYMSKELHNLKVLISFSSCDWRITKGDISYNKARRI
jgi:hypothetical protein